MISITNDKKKIPNILVVIFWLAVWQVASMIIQQELILASPLVVLKTLFSLIGEKFFWSSIVYSFLRIVCGFLLAIVVAIFLSALSAINVTIRALLEPFFGVIKSIPVVSFIILVLIWSGSSNLSVVISFLMVLPIIYTNLLEGILRTDPKLLEMAQVFRVSFIKKLQAIYIPSAMPYFISGCKVGLGLCWKSGIAAEVIGLPSGSIGERLYQSKIFLNTGELFSWTIVIILISYLFENIFLKFLYNFERRLERSMNG